MDNFMIMGTSGHEKMCTDGRSFLLALLEQNNGMFQRFKKVGIPSPLSRKPLFWILHNGPNGPNTKPRFLRCLIMV